MNSTKRYLLILVCLINNIVLSQDGGRNTYEFLNLPLSARAIALGGNLISTRDNDLNISFNNPALLNDSMNNKVAVNYVNYFGDINYGYAAIAKHIKSVGNFSAGIQYLNYGNFIRADESGNTDGTFGANEMSLNVSYSRSILDSNLFIGANLKTIYSYLDSYYSLGSALDLGAVYSIPGRGLGLAAVIKNVGYQWKPYVAGNREKLPFEIQLGFSKKLRHVPFRLSMVYENVEKWDLTYEDPSNPFLTIDPLTGEAIKQNKTKLWSDKLMRHIVVGGEFLITKNFFLRAGYNYQRRKELKIPEKRGMTGFSFGFGFRIYKFQFSFGRAIYHLAGASNNFSIRFDINSFYSKK